MQKTILILGLAAFTGLSSTTSYELNRSAYVVESREITRRHFTHSLHDDFVIETLSGIWNVATDTFLSRGINARDYGDFLDFDLASNLSVFRREENPYNYAENAFIIEVRNPQGEILFSKRDTVSHSPEAYLASEGKYLLSRTNNADTLQLTLELHSVETGGLIWRRTPTDNPRWRLSNDGKTFIELLDADNDSFYDTAVLCDILTQSELARINIEDFTIRRDSIYLGHFDSAVAVIGGESGTLLYNEKSDSLSPISNFRVGSASFSQSPKLDAQNDFIILPNYSSAFGDYLWAVFDTKTGERIATNIELGNPSTATTTRADPAISADGQLVYQVVDAGEIEVWNPHTKTLVRTLNYTNIPFEQLLPSVDDRYLLACALSGINDDFMVLIDTETSLPVYSKFFDDPDPFDPPTSQTYVVGFNRTLFWNRGSDRYYLVTVHGIEGYDFLTGEQVYDGADFIGKAITSQYVETESSWVTVYETGRIKIEPTDKDQSLQWIQLPITLGLDFASVDRVSGSVAIQRDTVFLITHPFDNREDQWIVDLSLGIYPISLHREGTWLAAHYRGIYDLTTNEWILEDPYLNNRYAIDETSASWAFYDPSSYLITVRDHAKEDEVEIYLQERIDHFHAMQFSTDGSQIYLLGKPTGGAFYDQSLFLIDLDSKSIVKQIDLEETEDSYLFTQIQGGPEQVKVTLARRNGELRIVDLSTGLQSLPAIIEPVYSPTWGDGLIQLSQPTSDGTLRFVSESGHIYQLREAKAKLIRSELTYSRSHAISLEYDRVPESTYWIRSSKDLEKWSTLPPSEQIETWFDTHDQGFFQVYQCETNN